jgi:hypothetical protein
MIGRMITEIQDYLSSPMRDAQSPDEQEERRSLCELLALLKSERA